MAEDSKHQEALVQNQAALEALENAERGEQKQTYEKTDLDRKHEAARKAVDMHYDKELLSFAKYGYERKEINNIKNAEALAKTFSDKVDAVLAGEKSQKGAEEFFKTDLEDRFVQESKGVEDAQYLHRILELDNKSVKDDLDRATKRGKVSMTRLELYADLNGEIEANILQRHQDFLDQQENLRKRFEALQQPELDEYRALEGNWGLGEKGRRRRELKRSVGDKVEAVDKKFEKFTKFHETFRSKLEKKFDDRRRKYEAGADAAQYNIRLMGDRVQSKLNQVQNSPAERQEILEALQAFMQDKSNTDVFKKIGITKPSNADQIHLLEVIMSQEFTKTRNEIEQKNETEKQAKERTQKNTEALTDIQEARKKIREEDLSIPDSIDTLNVDEAFKGIDRTTVKTDLIKGKLVQAIEKHLFGIGIDLVSEVYGTKDYENLGVSTKMKGLLLFLFENGSSTDTLKSMPQEIREAVFVYFLNRNQELDPLKEELTQAKKIQKTVDRLQSSDGVVAKAQRCMVMSGDPAKQQKALEEFLTAYNLIFPELDPFLNTEDSKEWTQFFREKTGAEFETITKAVKAITELAEKLRTYKDDEVDEYFKKETQREKELKVAETTLKQKEALYQEAARSDSAQAATSSINISTSGTQQTGADSQPRTTDPAVNEALGQLTKAQDKLAELQGKEDTELPTVDQDWQQTYGATLSELRDFPFAEKFPVRNPNEGSKSKNLSELLNSTLNQETDKELRDRFIERVAQNNMFDSLTQMPKGKQLTLNIKETENHKISIPDTFTSTNSVKAEVDFSEPGTGISLTVKRGGMTANSGDKIKVFAKVVEGKTVVENAVIVPKGAEDDTSKRKTALCTNFSIA